MGELPSSKGSLGLVVKVPPAAGVMTTPPKKRPLPGWVPETNQRPAMLGVCTDPCHADHSAVCSGELFTMYSSATSAGAGPFVAPSAPPARRPPPPRPRGGHVAA